MLKNIIYAQAYMGQVVASVNMKSQNFLFFLTEVLRSSEQIIRSILGAAGSFRRSRTSSLIFDTSEIKNPVVSWFPGPGN